MLAVVSMLMLNKSLHQVSPLEVHKNLRKYNTSFVILEDSICLAHRERCSTPDIIDLTNGHVRLSNSDLLITRLLNAPLTLVINMRIRQFPLIPDP